jgi:hypothetical protein
MSPLPWASRITPWLYMATTLNLWCDFVPWCHFESSHHVTSVTKLATIRGSGATQAKFLERFRRSNLMYAKYASSWVNQCVLRDSPRTFNNNNAVKPLPTLALADPPPARRVGRLWDGGSRGDFRSENRRRNPPQPHRVTLDHRSEKRRRNPFVSPTDIYHNHNPSIFSCLVICPSPYWDSCEMLITMILHQDYNFHSGHVMTLDYKHTGTHTKERLIYNSPVMHKRHTRRKGWSRTAQLLLQLNGS